MTASSIQLLSSYIICIEYRGSNNAGTCLAECERLVRFGLADADLLCRRDSLRLR